MHYDYLIKTEEIDILIGSSRRQVNTNKLFSYQY
jgi:hypothetical protein